jgi:hypothetical protein
MTCDGKTLPLLILQQSVQSSLISMWLVSLKIIISILCSEQRSATSSCDQRSKTSSCRKDGQNSFTRWATIRFPDPCNYLVTHHTHNHKDVPITLPFIITIPFKAYNKIWSSRHSSMQGVCFPTPLLFVVVVVVVSLALQPIVVVFSQPGSGL